MALYATPSQTRKLATIDAIVKAARESGELNTDIVERKNGGKLLPKKKTPFWGDAEGEGHTQADIATLLYNSAFDILMGTASSPIRKSVQDEHKPILARLRNQLEQFDLAVGDESADGSEYFKD